MSRAPTSKQLAFIEAYNETGNATEAHRRAYGGKMGDKARKVEAQRLLKNPYLIPYLVRSAAIIEQRVAKAAEIVGISKEPLLRKLGAMAGSTMKNYVKFNEWGEPRLDFTNLSDDAWKAIRELTITETKIPTPDGAPEKYLVSTKVRLHDSLGSIRELCQLLGFTKQDNPDDDLERMTTDELKRSVIERFGRLVSRATSGGGTAS